MILNPEQALTGALLIDPLTVRKCGNLKPDMFTDALLGRIYLEYVRACDFGYPANLVTLAENIPDVSRQELMDCIKQCADSTVTSAAAGKYADAVVAAYKARRAPQLVNAVNFQSADIERQIGELVNDLKVLRDGGRITA